MDADSGLDALVVKQVGVALSQAVADLHGAANGFNHAAKLDDRSVARSLDNAPIVHRDRRVDEVAAQRPQPGERALLVGPGQPAVADNVGDQDRRDFP